MKDLKREIPERLRPLDPEQVILIQNLRLRMPDEVQRRWPLYRHQR
jgi:hypothetical protein